VYLMRPQEDTEERKRAFREERGEKGVCVSNDDDSAHFVFQGALTRSYRWSERHNVRPRRYSSLRRILCTKEEGKLDGG
jgi:hypothetical protein